MGVTFLSSHSYPVFSWVESSSLCTHPVTNCESLAKISLHCPILNSDLFTVQCRYTPVTTSTIIKVWNRLWGHLYFQFKTQQDREKHLPMSQNLGPDYSGSQGKLPGSGFEQPTRKAVSLTSWTRPIHLQNHVLSSFLSKQEVIL